MNNSKKLLITLAASVIFALTGCSSTPAVNSTDSTTSTADTQNITPQQGYYDDIFVEIDQSTHVGPPATYEETISIISNSKYGGIDSFYLVETVKALTLSECEKLSGWEEWFESRYALSYDEIDSDGKDYWGDNTIYEVKVIEDLISGEKYNTNIYLATSMGNPRIQEKGDPVYSPGERFTVAVHPKAENSDITRSCGGFIFRYDIQSSDGNFKALSRNNYVMDAFNISNSENISTEAVTSTTANPVIYTQELPLDDLTEFIRQDWKTRQISRHFSTN